MFVAGKTGGDFSIQRMEERKKPVILRSAACAGERMAATDPRTEAPVRLPACPDALNPRRRIACDVCAVCFGMRLSSAPNGSYGLLEVAGGPPALAEFHV